MNQGQGRAEDRRASDYLIDLAATKHAFVGVCADCGCEFMVNRAAFAKLKKVDCVRCGRPNVKAKPEN